MTATTESDQVPPVRSALLAASKFHRHEDLLDTPVRGGDRDDWSTSSVLDLLPTLPTWPSSRYPDRRTGTAIAAQAVLEWLNRHPGAGWQARWLCSGVDDGSPWPDQLTTCSNSAGHEANRQALIAGMSSLLLCPAPGLMETSNTRRIHSYGCTTEVSG
jgi:hypothetical protein